MSRNTPYNPEQWESGEVITQEKLQNIENGITDIDNNLRDLILVKKNNPINQYPDNLLWFESETMDIQVPTNEEFEKLNNDFADLNNLINNTILLSTNSTLELEWFQGYYNQTGSYVSDAPTQITTKLFKLPFNCKIILTCNDSNYQLNIKEFIKNGESYTRNFNGTGYNELIYTTLDTEYYYCICVYNKDGIVPSNSNVISIKYETPLFSIISDLEDNINSISDLRENISILKNETNERIDKVNKFSNKNYPSLEWTQGYYNPNGLLITDEARQITTQMFQVPSGFTIKISCINHSNQLNIKEFVKEGSSYRRISNNTGYDVLSLLSESTDNYYTIGIFNSNGISPSDDTGLTIEYSSPLLSTITNLENMNNELNAKIKDCVNIKNTEDTDCNMMNDNGIYKVDTTYNNIPSDMVNNGVLTNFVFSNTRKIQLLSQYVNKTIDYCYPKLWYRTTGNDNNGFSDWINVSPKKVQIKAISNTKYKIAFGKYYTYLNYTNDTSKNSDLWNLYGIYDTNDTLLVTTSTDIIGPIKEVNEADFMGGVHGDEKNNILSITCDGLEWDRTHTIVCDEIRIIMISDIYRVSSKEHIYDRYVSITITNGKINVDNNYICLVNDSIIQRATNGGLIAVRNTNLSGVYMNNYYSNTPPTNIVNNKSHNNVSGTLFLTNGGSITVNNIIGHEQDTFAGYLNVFINENPIRNKIYLDVISNGSTPINQGQEILGKFEYLFN